MRVYSFRQVLLNLWLASTLAGHLCARLGGGDGKDAGGAGGTGWRPLELVERDVPEPTRGEVRVRVEVCGVCHSDSFTVEGQWGSVSLTCDEQNWLRRRMRDHAAETPSRHWFAAP